MYVFGEKEGEEIIPRRVGEINAFMLEFVYGSPVGHILSEISYKVPHDDLTEEERKSLVCSHANWSIHHKRFLKNHPTIHVHDKK